MLNQNATSHVSVSTISVRRFCKLAIGKPSSGFSLQGQCHIVGTLRFVPWLDLFIEPVRRFVKGCDMVWLTLPNADHRNYQEYEGCGLK